MREAVRLVRDLPRAPVGAPPAPDLIAVVQVGGWQAGNAACSGRAWLWSRECESSHVVAGGRWG